MLSVHYQFLLFFFKTREKNCSLSESQQRKGTQALLQSDGSILTLTSCDELKENVRAYGILSNLEEGGRAQMWIT